MSRAASLLQLQTLDSEIDARQARLQAIAAALGADPAIRAAQQALAAAQAQLHQARVAAQNLEYEGQNLNEKIAESSQRMYGGRVGNPKELQDLAKDIDSLQRRRSALEELQFEALMAVEAAEAKVQALSQALAGTEAAKAASNSSLNDERQQIAAHVERLQIGREATLASINSADLALYDRLRVSKRGRAVVRLEEGACTGCGVEPSSSRIQTARRDNDLILCGNCGRILSAD